MAIITRIACDKSHFGSQSACPFLDITDATPEGLPAAIATALTEARWITNGDAYHCPRHNPAHAGVPIVLGEDYIEPVLGIRLRIQEGERVRAELLLDKDRYDIDHNGSGAWRAKHVSEDWPT